MSVLLPGLQIGLLVHTLIHTLAWALPLKLNNLLKLYIQVMFLALWMFYYCMYRML